MSGLLSSLLDAKVSEKIGALFDARDNPSHPKISADVVRFGTRMVDRGLAGQPGGSEPTSVSGRGNAEYVDPRTTIKH